MAEDTIRGAGIGLEGVVRFFHDEGYSAGALQRLVTTLASTSTAP